MAKAMAWEICPETKDISCWRCIFLVTSYYSYLPLYAVAHLALIKNPKVCYSIDNEIDISAASWWFYWHCFQHYGCIVYSNWRVVAHLLWLDSNHSRVFVAFWHYGITMVRLFCKQFYRLYCIICVYIYILISNHDAHFAILGLTIISGLNGWINGWWNSLTLFHWLVRVFLLSV